MSITIKDIAKKAGVSPSTVSRTINNHYSISEETKEKVRKVMDELGYVYDKSHIKKHDVGVVFPRSMVDVYENPFYLEIVIIRKQQHRQSHKVHHLYHQLHH